MRFPSPRLLKPAGSQSLRGALGSQPGTSGTPDRLFGVQAVKNLDSLRPRFQLQADDGIKQTIGAMDDESKPVVSQLDRKLDQHTQLLEALKYQVQANTMILREAIVAQAPLLYSELMRVILQALKQWPEAKNAQHGEIRRALRTWIEKLRCAKPSDAVSKDIQARFKMTRDELLEALKFLQSHSTSAAIQRRHDVAHPSRRPLNLLNQTRLLITALPPEEQGTAVICYRACVAALRISTGKDYDRLLDKTTIPSWENVLSRLDAEDKDKKDG